MPACNNLFPAAFHGRAHRSLIQYAVDRSHHSVPWVISTRNWEPHYTTHMPQATDRQTDTHTHRQTDTVTHTQTHRQTQSAHTERQTQSHTQTDRHSHTHTDTQTQSHTQREWLPLGVYTVCMYVASSLKVYPQLHTTQAFLAYWTNKQLTLHQVRYSHTHTHTGERVNETDKRTDRQTQMLVTATNAENSAWEPSASNNGFPHEWASGDPYRWGHTST